MSGAELIEEDKLGVCGDVLKDLTHVVPRTTIFCIKGLKERGLTAVRFGRPNPVVALLTIQEGKFPIPGVGDIVITGRT